MCAVDLLWPGVRCSTPYKYMKEMWLDASISAQVHINLERRDGENGEPEKNRKPPEKETRQGFDTVAVPLGGDPSS